MALADIPLRQFLNEAVIHTRPTRSRASSSTATTPRLFVGGFRIFQAAATAVRHVAESRT
jgi:hypothetical protein